MGRNTERFWSKVAIGSPDECWEWLAGKNDGGYGYFWNGERQMGAHRVAWELVRDPIPDELFVCHHCDNRACCNPAHLFVGTPQDNLTDAAKKGRMSRQCGELHPESKLTEFDVQNVHYWLERGFTQRQVADILGVAQQTISKIKTGKSWSHL